MERVIQPAGRATGVFQIPGDKSIGHRSLLLSALAQGKSSIRGLPDSADVNSTRRCLSALGVRISDASIGGAVEVFGRGPLGLTESSQPLDAGNSGTTARLLLGVLAPQSFDSVVDGDQSLRSRPMGRATEPLTQMGARFTWIDRDGYLPVKVHGSNLHFADLVLPIASAQVKSALLLAGLCSGQGCTVRESLPTRDHTELMLAAQGVALERTKGKVTLAAASSPLPLDITVPGDVSSAAFFIGAAVLVQGSRIKIDGVGLNQGRTGLLEVLRSMGARVEWDIEGHEAGEPVGSILAEYAPLHGIDLSKYQVPALVDELPLLAVLATQAHGRTSVTGAAELRVKESDRISAITAGLNALGAVAEPLPDGFVIDGPQQLHGGVVDSQGDHRIAMALAVAGLVADSPVTIRGAECVEVSFPQFWEVFAQLVQHG